MSELSLGLTPLPQRLSETLTCINCKHFLSIPPILLTSEGYQCGRCTPKQGDYLTAEAYQSLASLFLFPCKYKSLGCTKQVRFADVHENKCEFRTIKCPQSSCKAEIRMGDVLSHFERKHQELVMTTKQIAIDDALESRQNMIIKRNHDVFLLEMFVSQEYCCWLTLSYFKKPSEEVFYQLRIRSDHSKIGVTIDHQKILKYSSNNEQELLTDQNLVPVKKFKDVVQSDKIKLTIEFENTEAKPQHEFRQLLEELECSVCQEYMIPPIYACTTGHSICQSCREKVEECPLCRSKYGGARNFALEKLSERDYSCKYQADGCKFVGSVAQIRSHEGSCLEPLIRCPLAREEHCSWRGAMAAVYNHSKTAHPQRVRKKLNEKMSRNLVRGGQSWDVVAYDNHVFKISAKYDVDANFVGWAVRIIGTSLDAPPKYYFTLSLTNNTGVFIKMGEFCYNYVHADEDDKPPVISIPKLMLLPFVDTQKKLIFSIDISKIPN